MRVKRPTLLGVDLAYTEYRGSKPTTWRPGAERGKAGRETDIIRRLILSGTFQHQPPFHVDMPGIFLITRKFGRHAGKLPRSAVEANSPSLQIARFNEPLVGRISLSALAKSRAHLCRQPTNTRIITSG